MGAYVPEKRMLALVPDIMFAKSKDFKQNQTRLKLNCVKESTLYIQVEECLSVSQYHHSAGQCVEGVE
jgi:hypothetical protein